MTQVREWVDLASLSQNPCREESVYVMVVAEGKDRAQQGKWELTPFLVRDGPEDAGHGPAAGDATDDVVMDSLASASCFFAGSGQKSVGEQHHCELVMERLWHRMMGEPGVLPRELALPWLSPAARCNGTCALPCPPEPECTARIR